VKNYSNSFCGSNQQILYGFLRKAGFSNAVSVDSFALFSDTSEYKPLGFPISLNVIATR
jgi:hypothetical protein